MVGLGDDEMVVHRSHSFDSRYGRLYIWRISLEKSLGRLVEGGGVENEQLHQEVAIGEFAC